MPNHSSAILITICLFIGVPSAWSQSLFKRTEPSSSLANVLAKESRNVAVFQLDKTRLKSLYTSAPKEVLLPLDLPDGSTITLALTRSSILSSGFRILTSHQKEFKGDFEKALHFQGTVSGHPGSLAAISFTSTGISGLFSFGSGNFNLGPVNAKSAPAGTYALFNDRDAIRKNDFQCHSDLLPKQRQEAGKSFQPSSGKRIQTDNCRRVEIYIECDHQTYLDKGSTVAATVNWMTSLFNIVATLYAREGIVVRMSETMVHTQPDSYPYATSFEALSAFGDSVSIRPHFNGDLGHLISTRPQANGGVAYLDVLCSQGLGYSNVYADFLPLPFYSWNTNVITHELGHNFGSPHTQSCSWEISPGIYGMLDSCYFAEDLCYNGPRIAKVGTVMSYCHLMSKGIDLSLGFGPLPGDLIRSRYQEASCLQGSATFPILAVTPPDTICTGSTFPLSVTLVAGATYAWTGPSGFTSSLRNPTLTSVSANQSGTYSVVVTVNGCSSVSLNTRLTVSCINSLPLPAREICLPASFEVDFTAAVSPNAGNQYSVQLSSANGSFASPQTIGTLSSVQKSGKIQVVIPSGLAIDSGYQIRVVSSNPVSIGQVSNQKLKIRPRPSAPAASDVSKCQPSVFQLNASGQGTLRWYNSATATTQLATGSVFTTPLLSTTTSYWVESQEVQKYSVGSLMSELPDTTNAYNTYHGLYLKVKKNLILDSMTVYAITPGTLRFNVKDSANTQYFKSLFIPLAGIATGQKVKVGISLSPGVYRIDGEGSAISSLLRLNNFSDFPIQNPAMDILGSSVPSRYYFFHQFKLTVLGCPSNRKEVKAIITPGPSAPTVTNGMRCDPGMVVLHAEGAVAGQSYRWYVAETGGTPIAGQSGSSYTTPSLFATKTFYVSMFDSAGCEGPRSAVIATINPFTASPVVTPVNRCGPGAVTAVANGAAPTDSYRWYAEATGVPPLPVNGNTYIIGPISGDTVLYVSIMAANGCESFKVPLPITVRPLPGTAVASDSSRCGPGVLYLTATGGNAGETYRWYTTLNALPADSVAGGALGYITTPYLAQSRTYYVVRVLNGCESAVRKPVNAHVGTLPVVPVLTYSDGYLIGTPDTNFQWFRNDTLLSVTGDSLLATSNGNYQLYVTGANGCQSFSNVQNVILQSVDELTEQNLAKVFPNPSAGSFTATWPETGPAVVSIFDSRGRQILQSDTVRSQFGFSIHDEASGIYWLKVQTPSFVRTIRLKKQ
jgi:Ig-like domain CHU_C associated/Metallo-peptidase family M12/Reprolysin family propeptide